MEYYCCGCKKGLTTENVLHPLEELYKALGYTKARILRCPDCKVITMVRKDDDENTID